MWNVANEDNLTYLGSLPKGKTDLVFTSPPYGIGASYENATGEWRKGPDPRGGLQTNDEYVEGLRPAMKEIVRILRPGGSLGWQTGYRYGKARGKRALNVPIDVLTVPVFEKLGLEFFQRIIWTTTPRYAAQSRLTSRHEILTWMTKPGGRMTYNQVPDKGLTVLGKPYKIATDVWEVPRVGVAERMRKATDCLMPLPLAKRFVAMTTKPGDTVVDPWAGTGTSIVAAAILNRQGFGCDKEAERVKTAYSELAAADATYTAYDPVCPHCGGTGEMEGIGGRMLPCPCGA